MKNRQTKASKDIELLINQSDKSYTPAEILSEMKESVDRVTVYRVLSRLEEQGKIHKFVGLDGKIHYAKCDSPSCEDINHQHNHAHAHFSCTQCNEITCLTDVVPHFHLPKNYLLEETNIVLSGICNECSNL